MQTDFDYPREISYWCRLQLQFAPLSRIAQEGLTLVKEYLQAKSHGALASGLEALQARVLEFFTAHVSRPFLLPHHQALLDASRISPAVAAARGYRTVWKKADLRVLGFSQGQQNVPGLLIPVISSNGEKTCQLRPDQPRTDKNGKVVKYETPAGGRLILDCNPFIQADTLRDPKIPLFLTEGSRKADAGISAGLCTLGLLGVTAYRGRNEFGGKTAFPEWENIALNGRKTYLVFDSDVMEKEPVYYALRRLSEFLKTRDAVVSFVYLPPAPTGGKTGLDDFLAAGNTVADLLKLASTELLRPVGSKDETEHQTWPYKIEANQIFFLSRRPGEEHFQSVPVADFTAAIDEEISAESGEITYLVSGTGKRGGPYKAEITARQFADERALASTLCASVGAYDGVYAGMRKHLGPAIQKMTNGNLRRIRKFDRTGWENDTFLIPGRTPDDIQIGLQGKLPYRVESGELAPALSALDSLLASGNVAPILACLFGAPLARAVGWGERYALFLVGRSGTLKTSTVQTAMSIYGPDFQRDELLIRWGALAGTQNALMRFATSAADLPLLIDNYKPNTTRDPHDFTKLIHAMVEGGEKDRLNKNSDPRETRPIYTWPLCTGEDIPDNDPATLARCLVIEFRNRRHETNRQLSQAQQNARHLCKVGNLWIDWIETAGRAVCQEIADRFGERRQQWAEFLGKIGPEMVNPLRVAGNLAANELAWTCATRHPDLSRVLRPYREQYREALEAVARFMARSTTESLEAQRFLATMRELLATERAQLLPVGKAPHQGIQPERLAGWKDSDDSVYLLPEVAQKMVLDVLGRNGLNSISLHTLYGQLFQLGAIASHDKDRLTKQKRVAPDTVSRLLHLTPSALEMAPATAPVSELDF